MRKKNSITKAMSDHLLKKKKTKHLKDKAWGLFLHTIIYDLTKEQKCNVVNSYYVMLYFNQTLC